MGTRRVGQRRVLVPFYPSIATTEIVNKIDFVTDTKPE